MSTISSPRLYRVTIVLLSFALAVATALAAYFATTRIEPGLAPQPSAPARVVVPGGELVDPECAHARVLC